MANQGNGGYLQTGNVSQDADGNWMIGPEGTAEPLDETRMYVVAINDFLLSGNETGLGFLNAEELDESELVVTGDYGDIRQALIDQMQLVYGLPE